MSDVAGAGRESSRRFSPSGALCGELWVPADKSVSHRAALFGAMADGESRVRGYLDSADTRSTLLAVSALGAELFDATGRELAPLDLRRESALPEEIAIRGVGLRGARAAEIDVGNAGTLIRLLPGWLAGQGEGDAGELRRWRLDGDESIRRRPMARIAEPLRRMGARIECALGDLAPLEVTGARLRGIEYESPVASAQVKSCILIAGLLADGPTTVNEPERSRDHTERMLAAAGAELTHSGLAVTVHPAEHLVPLEISVPGDISSAAFFLVAATLVPGSEVTLRGVGVNPTRTGVLEILERMGARIEVLDRRESGGEPVADLLVRAAQLRGTEIGGAEIPRAIDELPIIALAASFAEGPTVIRDAAELRRKESDRVETVVAALQAIGAGAEAIEDGLVVDGTGGSSPGGADAGALPPGGTIHSHGDHRIAMLGAIAGLACGDGVTVLGMDAAAVSYPSFTKDLAGLL